MNHPQVKWGVFAVIARPSQGRGDGLQYQCDLAHYHPLGITLKYIETEYHC